MSETRRIHGLDAMRGLAALCVFAFHAHGLFAVIPDVFAKGYLAVDFFMMLSGYVMARTYEARMHQGLPPEQFFLLRYRRLWLTMTIGGLFGISYLWLVAGDPMIFAAALVLNLLLIPFPLNNELFPLNLPAWSVFYELAANLTHVVVLRRLRTPVLLGFALLLTVPLAYFTSVKGDVDFGAFKLQFGLALIRALVSYSIGVVLWRWWQDEPPIKVPAMLAIVAAPLTMITPLVALGWAYDTAFTLVVCPLLMAGGLRLRGAPRWATLSGMISFPLYAVHMAVLRSGYINNTNPWLTTAAALFAGLALTWWLSLRAARAKVRVKP
jgi:peptidoglycan/LPS O-acetylase OafA/YrhL